MIPDYVFDENGDIQIASPKNRRVVKKVKIMDDGIHFEKALKSKAAIIGTITIKGINSFIVFLLF